MGQRPFAGIDTGDATLDGQWFHGIDPHLQSDMESGCSGWHLERGHPFRHQRQRQHHGQRAEPIHLQQRLDRQLMHQLLQQ
jgi:hypothetical protein